MTRSDHGSDLTPDGGVTPAGPEPVVIAVYYPTAEGFDVPPTAADLQDTGPGPSLAARLRAGLALGVSGGLATGGLIGGLNPVFSDGPAGLLLLIGAVGVVGLTIAFLLRSRGVLVRPGSLALTTLAVTLLAFGAILLLLRDNTGWLVVVLGGLAAVVALRYRNAERTVATQRAAWLAGWPRLVQDPRYMIGRVSDLTLKHPNDQHFSISGSVTYPDAGGVEHVVAIPGGVVPRAGGVQPPALYAPVVVWHSPDNSVVLLRFSAALAP
ncbi:hypothetical protein EXU48_10380 [Occultella glacieicola]|uniref:DUF4190 domain-containing protein n=1 Tax=Occultella glacieicola TaxID=2518684 RepID=A0ABY2E4U7_9MICO|nr:hypothetical protein [Occultella glacieicola]TDE93877.1 hypothetical protein EXU48_10380 [Occultella glacieicola]